MTNNELSTNRRGWLLILVMLVLLFIGPFKIEIRVSTYFYPIVSLSDFTIYAWTWVYRILGYGDIGFISYSPFVLNQMASFYTLFQFVFLGVFCGSQLGLASTKTAINIGYVSLFPGLLILGVNLLGNFIPGATEIIVPIPIPLVTILGLFMIRYKSHKQVPDEWLTEEKS